MQVTTLKFDNCHLCLFRLLKMERFWKEQRVIIVKTHYKNGESYAETARKLRQIIGRESAPNVSITRRVVKKFEETGSIIDIKNHLRQRTGRSLENIAAVNESVAENPKTSIRHRSQQLKISRSTTQRILTSCVQGPANSGAQTIRPRKAPAIRSMGNGAK